MEYVKLGHSDLNVSRICLGCMGFGDPTIGQHSWTIGEEPTREIIRRSLELGVNFFDTAIAYQLGTSEQFVGRALRDMARRGDVVVATKFLPRTDEEIQQGINGRQHVLNNIDSSLQHLGMDYVDLYIYHIWDYKTPAEEIMEGMNDTVRTGKARYIGIANAYAYQVAKMNAMAEQHGWAKFISVQNHYNLIMREEEREMFPFCHEENIAMTPYSALASGKLAKRPGETSKRQQEDSFMHFKYDATAEQDTYRLAQERDEGYTVVQAIDGWRDAPDAAAKKRIDQIWCSKAVPVKSSRVVFNGLQEPQVSDHAGVLIEL